MDTSKTRSIKSLLLQAWRERWSAISWGIHIKNVLPRGVSGDVYDLADCILQQALVGPGPNNLFMSYLMHSLSSRVVSYGAVLSSIGRYQSFYKPYCILSLLDLLKTFQSRIGCHGNEEECIILCKGVVSITHWLYSCIFYSISNLAELKHSPEHISIMEKSYKALFYFSNSTFIKSLLYVGRFEDLGMYAQMLQKHKELKNKISQVSTITISKETIEGALSLVSFVDCLPMVPSEQVQKSNQQHHILASTINIMVSIDAILNPTNDVLVFVSQLILIKRVQNISLSQLYYEIIRACFIGIADTSGSSGDFKWLSFTFLKVRQLISEIYFMYKDIEKDALEKGLHILLQYSPLLNVTDFKSNCDCFQYLINGFYKIGLLTEVQIRRLITRRQSESFKHANPKQNQQDDEANATLILRAEVTVLSILKSLNSEYIQIQELLSILHLMVQGKNFELILSAAAATSNLHTFISKLIHFNDRNIYNNAETPKAAQTRALLFDITFLLLCYITQYYGLETVTENTDKKNSFFVQWASQCLAEGGKFKCPELLLSRCDQTSIEILLSQFLNTEKKFETVQVKWHEVVINAPAVVREIIVAWEHGALSTEKVKVILDHIKGQMCFLPVCISAWLSNYINVLPHKERLKPMNILQQFLAPLYMESNTYPRESSSGSDWPTPQIAGNQGNLYYAERSNLMIGLINKMLCDLHPPSETETKQAPIIPHRLTIRAPLAKILDEIFNRAHSKGFLDLKSIHYFNSLLCLGGSKWLCESLVERILNYKFLKDINRAVDVILGIFYLDIEQCALALLSHVIPFYLYNEVHQEQLAEPYGSAVARLIVITTYAALQSRQCSVAIRSERRCKRAHHEVDIDDIGNLNECRRPSKIQRRNIELLEDTPFELQSLSEDHMQYIATNPINKAIADLMRTLMVVTSDATVSARSHFPIRFLEQVVFCAKDQAPDMLQFVPLGLVGLLLKKFPEEFSHELVLSVSSMQSPRARKVAALSLCQLTIVQN